MKKTHTHTHTHNSACNDKVAKGIKNRIKSVPEFIRETLTEPWETLGTADIHTRYISHTKQDFSPPHYGLGETKTATALRDIGFHSSGDQVWSTL